ncbi:MAG: dipicolinate synthase subunit DpsA [Defluviitaleaceae bacterium]|nr:dipicolinate synthase subunit DpsA [Defluviitaleaceae bacterium]MCL2239762.1 dipicolinate synthase subunit DpsA [Defluviitaleaceae bacterium]
MRTFSVVGGDKRNAALAEMLYKQGHQVKLYGFVNYERELSMQCKNLEEAIACADYIIGPIPCAHHGGTLNAPFHNAPIFAQELFGLLKPHQIFMAGYMKPEIFAMAKAHNVRALDMLQREELLVANAIPTAEGAIKIAIEETDITLHDNPMLIIGYGRIGSILAAMLRGMGARVCAVVNSKAAAARARSCGHEAVFFEDMEGRLAQAAVIFNTVPEILLDGGNMGHIDKKALIIDLASPPYGVDVNASRAFGLKVLFATSLPGKIAPVTTAGYILDTVNYIIEEMEGGTI